MHPDKCGVAQATEDEKEAIEARFKALHTASEAGENSMRIATLNPEPLNRIDPEP